MPQTIPSDFPGKDPLRELPVCALAVDAVVKESGATLNTDANAPRVSSEAVPSDSTR